MRSENFQSAFANYPLKRIPCNKNHPLQAWDAADEYLLSYLAEETLLSAKTRILIINDSFGALCINLKDYPVTNWSDSFLSQLACTENFQNNRLTALPTYIRSTQSPEGLFDLVIIKVPKVLALLEDQLIRLKQHIHASTSIIGAGMVKHLPKSATELFEKILGNTTTSLAKKKARLIFSQFDNQTAQKTPFPKCTVEPTTTLTLCQHANVFSKDKIDIGTRFFLEQFKKLPKKENIVDLGCGNGLLGIVAQRQQPQAQLTFLDESYMAVASAEASYQQTFPELSANFIASNALSNFNGKADLILCNPPFHQQHSTGDFIAWQMFLESYQALESDGELWIVGNRHLNYHSKLKKLFGQCDLIASNKKFVILRSVKN